jgi:hypothetical protein
MSNRDEIVERLTAQLAAVEESRGAYAGAADRAAGRERLREWQAGRLARTHADLLASRRFGKTAAFFLSDIYGATDLAAHEEHVRTVLPAMKRLLPDAGLETVADAIELSALSEALDLAMVDALGAARGTLTPAEYGRAYRAVGRRAERERQIALIDQLGRSLDRLTRSRMIGLTLAAMRAPARAAGFGALQNFLERGYDAFRRMRGADEFIARVTGRESELMEALFGGGDALLDGPVASTLLHGADQA